MFACFDGYLQFEYIGAYNSPTRPVGSPELFNKPAYNARHVSYETTIICTCRGSFCPQCRKPRDEEHLDNPNSWPWLRLPYTYSGPRRTARAAIRRGTDRRKSRQGVRCHSCRHFGALAAVENPQTGGQEESCRAEEASREEFRRLRVSFVPATDCPSSIRRKRHRRHTGT